LHSLSRNRHTNLSISLKRLAIIARLGSLLIEAS